MKTTSLTVTAVTLSLILAAVTDRAQADVIWQPDEHRCNPDDPNCEEVPAGTTSGTLLEARVGKPGLPPLPGPVADPGGNKASRLLDEQFDEFTGKLYSLQEAGARTEAIAHQHGAPAGPSAGPSAMRLSVFEPHTGQTSTVAVDLPSAPGDADNVAATLDPIGRRLYYQASSVLYAVDLGSGEVVDAVPLAGEVVDLLYDARAGVMYGLRSRDPEAAAPAGGWLVDDDVDLVMIDGGGVVTVLNGAPLPRGLVVGSSGFDSELGQYRYVGAAGYTNVLDVRTGQLLTRLPGSPAPPPGNPAPPPESD